MSFFKKRMICRFLDCLKYSSVRKFKLPMFSSPSALEICSQLLVASSALCTAGHYIFLWLPAPSPFSPVFLGICWSSQLGIMSMYYFLFKFIIFTKSLSQFTHFSVTTNIVSFFPEVRNSVIIGSFLTSHNFSPTESSVCCFQ